MISKETCHCGLKELFDFVKIQSKKSEDLHRFKNVMDVTQLLQKMKTSFRLSTIISKNDLRYVTIFCCEILLNLPDISMESDV